MSKSKINSGLGKYPYSTWVQCFVKQIRVNTMLHFKRYEKVTFGMPLGDLAKKKNRYVRECCSRKLCYNVLMNSFI